MSRQPMTTRIARPNSGRSRTRVGGAAVVAAMILLAACGSSGKDRGSGRPEPDDGLAAVVASYDLVAGRTGRFLVGLLSGDGTRLVGHGKVDLSFTFTGAGKQAVPEPGPRADASFLPLPGHPAEAAGPPRYVKPSEAGVYGARDVRFDKPGIWRVVVRAPLEGRRRQASASFQVLERSSLPAPGDRAPRTENPVVGAPDVDPAAIDSRADAATPVPDPELHSTTVAAALDRGQPLLVVVSTPTYCQSRFCGPITDSVSELARRHGERMAFVHLEVWRNFEAKQLNRSAAEWIFTEGTDDPREPWVFVVDRTGTIVERFDNVATDAELEQAVQRVSA